MEKKSIYFKYELRHISNIWIKLMKNVNGEIKKYNNKCYICLISILKYELIKLECCGLSLHIQCLQNYIQNKMENDGMNNCLKKYICLICQKQMMHRPLKIKLVGTV